MAERNEPYFHEVPAGVCPHCRGPLDKHPATSRVDNRTSICSDCGTAEALQVAGVSDKDYARVLLLARQARLENENEKE